MNEGRLYALHWAFFVDVMGMEFEDVYRMFLSWCQSIPADEMTGIMTLGDELMTEYTRELKNIFSDDTDGLYTEEEIWNDINELYPRLEKLGKPTEETIYAFVTRWLLKRETGVTKARKPARIGHVLCGPSKR